MHEVETMMYAKERGLPWHGLGVGVDGLQTAKQAIVAAGLDWEVELRKVTTLDGNGKAMEMPGFNSVMRKTDDRILGMVKARYVPLQNVEAFDFTDSLVDSSDAKYDTAGSLRDGRVVFLSMVAPDDVMIGGEDAHKMYILLRTSHDGSRAIGVYIVMIRTVCMNTLTWAIDGAKHSWSTPHTSTMQGKLQEARDTLQLGFKYSDAFNREAQRLMKAKVDNDRAVRILQTVLPNRPKTEERIDDIMTCLTTSDVNGYAGTGWGLMNALTEYMQHWRENIETEATLGNLLDGSIRNWRNATAKMILAA